MGEESPCSHARGCARRERSLPARVRAALPSFCKPRSAPLNFCGGGEIENPGAFTDFPVRLRRKIKLGLCSPATYLDIFLRTVPDRDASVRHIGDRQEQFSLLSIQVRDALIG